MKKWQIILVYLSMFGVFSCNKNSYEELIEYPITYTSYFISEPEINVYTKDGEITFVDLKNEIIERYKNSLTDLGSIEIQELMIATYLSADTVKLTLENRKEEKTRIVSEHNELICWEKQDTSVMSVYPVSFLDKLKYRPLYYEEFDVPWATGYSKVGKYKECFFIKKKNKGLEIPMFDYLFKMEFGLTTILGINNEFNLSGTLPIGGNDTLIIQEYFIEMK